MEFYKSILQIRCSENLYGTETIITAKFRGLRIMDTKPGKVVITVRCCPH